MLRKLFLFVAVFIVFFSFSQKHWKSINENALRLYPKMDRASQPTKFQLYQLDFQEFKNQLFQAPLDVSGVNSTVILSFPNTDGSFTNYQMYEAPVMEKGLMDKYPDIKSYIGKGVDNKRATIRVSVTLFGMHVMKRGADEPTTYIDTYTKDLNHYIVYSKNNISPSREFICGVEDSEDINENAQQFGKLKNNLINDSKFRTYRMAMACTIEYATFHVNQAGLNSGTEAQKKAAVLAAMNVTVTRLNSIYEIDLSLRMVLVANNDQIIFIISDNFTNNSSTALINESQSVIDEVIGFDNYDIGHTVSTGGGGLAQRPSVCTSGKARGITGSSAPVGDPYDVDYVAHEVGHQFNGNHTQNNNCNRANIAAREPGSASTIMGYAGICAPNVQNNSDAYFHAYSIQEMQSHILGNGNCAAFINNNNTPPVVSAGIDYTIPFGTAFILKGTATDTQSALTYCWEQNNNGNSTQPPLNTSTTGPNFRSLNPSSSPNRYMPEFSEVLNNNLVPTWEVVPSVARTMTFRLTVRDNEPVNGGQTSFDDTVITFANTGPFTVTAPSVNNTVFVGNSTQNITWNIAGTTANNINTANVNILYSTNNGATFPYTLAANTPNDGSQSVVIPNVISSNCRIMIEPVGNIYYALSRNIIVNTLSNQQFGLNNFKLYPNPNQGGFNISFDSNSQNEIKIELHDLRGRLIFNQNYANTGTFNQNIELNSLQSGIYIVNVNDGNLNQTQKIIIE